jgi:hypothetical protein
MAQPDEAGSSTPPANSNIKSVTRLKPKKSAGKPPKRDKPTKIFPTPRIAFAKQLDLLRTYALASGPENRAVPTEEAASIMKFVETTAAMANPFFTDTGLLQRTEAGMVPCAEVLSFQRTFSWSPETASHKLGPVIGRTWFATALLPRLGLRPMDENEALTVLADASAATLEYRPQLKVLLDYLQAAGLVERDGSQIRVRQEGAVAANVRAEAPPPAVSERRDPPMVPALNSSVTTAFNQATAGTCQFAVTVKVDMTEFATWTPDRIAAFFKGIAQVLAAKANVEQGASTE